VLHELGHGLHFAHTDPQLPWAFRNILTSVALSEVYSTFMELLLTEPQWYRARLGLSQRQAETCAAFNRFVSLAAVHYQLTQIEVEQHLRPRLTNSPLELERELLPFAERAEGRGFAFPRPAALVFYTDRNFGAACYIQAAVQAAQLQVLLRSRHGAEWWREPQAGELLLPFFRRGMRDGPERLAETLGAAPTNTDALGELVTAGLIPS